jgi:hypothetical protein
MQKQALDSGHFHFISGADPVATVGSPDFSPDSNLAIRPAYGYGFAAPSDQGFRPGHRRHSAPLEDEIHLERLPQSQRYQYEVLPRRIEEPEGQCGTDDQAHTL